ncbi:hypothetical protein [Thalassoroseus pseudoceratinae]|uniref:hypothetical protein n=1 Tax=Thalassoroseus pseudoceratinae TaxID=2713176 RepID=UPI0014214EC0|nr:hypothetical protein [Thalassoroseus pseudoceratinae]
MVFRFVGSLTLIVSIALIGVGLEKANLSLHREISRQHYRTDILREDYARLRLKSQELGAPTNMLEDLESGRIPVRAPERVANGGPRKMPLLEWRGRVPTIDSEQPNRR